MTGKKEDDGPSLRESRREVTAQLSGDERRELHQALLSAFPRLDQLDQLVSFGLGDNLQRIAGRDNLDVAIIKIIEATEATGRTKTLLEAAIRQNPGNALLGTVAQRLRATLDRPGTTSEGGGHARRASSASVRGLLFSAVALVFVGLGFVRPPATFELSLTLDRLSVEVDRWRENDTQSMFESAEMTLQIAGFSSVELGAGLLVPGETAVSGIAVPPEASVVTLVPGGSTPSVKFAHGTLRSLNLGPAARLTLERREESQSTHALWIAISPSQEEAGGAVEIRETAAFECSACDAITGMDPQRRKIVGPWTFQSNGRHLARFRGKAPRITLWPKPGSVLNDAGIHLKDNQRIAIARLEDDRPRSAVVEEGSIGFVSLRDVIPVAPGDYVEIDGVLNASITSLRVGSGITASITGVASSIRVGTNPSAMSRRQPMLFRHLVSRKDPTLFYVALAVIGTVGILILVRLIRKQRE